MNFKNYEIIEVENGFIIRRSHSGLNPAALIGIEVYIAKDADEVASILSVLYEKKTVE